ncbi:hypothetical protein [Sphingomonas bacterium]|uniref:hypothetical protein n=1 Tax=Sphingomonas bacterium TaxID=1895847 RepID=UPI00157638EC|nr:hypothetical protein [Sphingomonas bacterium]
MATLFLTLALSACSSPEGQAGPAPDDQRQLNDAAAMLDANSVGLNAVTSNESTP